MSGKDHAIVGGARRVWPRTRRAVADRMLREDKVTHHLAGGSLLAAQWGHRESSDMDVINEALTTGRSWEKTFPAEREPVPGPWTAGPPPPASGSER